MNTLYTKQSLVPLIMTLPRSIETLRAVACVNKMHNKPYGKLTRAAKQLEGILQEYQSIMEDLEDGNN